MEPIEGFTRGRKSTNNTYLGPLKSVDIIRSPKALNPQTPEIPRAVGSPRVKLAAQIGPCIGRLVVLPQSLGRAAHEGPPWALTA